MKTTVIFRTFTSGSDVIAIFPLEPWDTHGHHCASYQHIGQHGAASPSLTSVHTRPATPAEIAPLKTELERIGYDLHVVSRMPRNAAEVRRAKLTEICRTGKGN